MPRALILAALSLSPSLALADDPYASYRIPAHWWHSWSANVNATGNHVLSTSSGEEKDGHLDGRGFTTLSSGYDSDARSHLFALTLQLAGVRDRQEHSSDLLGLDDHGSRAETLESIDGFLAYSRYPWSAPLGFALSSGQSLRWNQSWFSRSSEFPSPPYVIRNEANLS